MKAKVKNPGRRIGEENIYTLHSSFTINDTALPFPLLRVRMCECLRSRVAFCALAESVLQHLPLRIDACASKHASKQISEASCTLRRKDLRTTGHLEDDIVLWFFVRFFVPTVEMRSGRNKFKLWSGKKLHFFIDDIEGKPQAVCWHFYDSLNVLYIFTYCLLFLLQLNWEFKSESANGGKHLKCVEHEQVHSVAPLLFSLFTANLPFQHQISSFAKPNRSKSIHRNILCRMLQSLLPLFSS